MADLRGTAWHRVVDPLGVLFALIIAGATIFLPFWLFRLSRIAAADPVALWSVPAGAASAVFFCACAAGLAFRGPVMLRLVLSGAALVVLAVVLGVGAERLLPVDSGYARVSVGSGAWVIFSAFALSFGDAMVRRQTGPVWRLAALGGAGGLLAAILASGLWSHLSILTEYANRADSFAQALRTHLALAGGSVLASCAIGAPLGIACARIASVRRSVMPVLSLVQTIPSMALFGLLIAPLAWVAANFPGAAAVGIAGIGAAPAFIALLAYALLPVVASTLSGLEGVPRAVSDAADGMGMTRHQRLWRIELPLAAPAILTGVRIVLVQNIGLTVIAGLAGGGGLGIFVFQGISQTATDLVLLGALPTVMMAFSAAIILDAIVDMIRTAGAGR